MCGRFAYNAEQITLWAKAVLGVTLDYATNLDVRPSQKIIAIASNKQPVFLSWGIQPSWSKHLIINAKAETVAEKKTFKDAFAHNRCLIPCSGWYEWRDEGGPRKQKYYFSATNREPLLMAGIWFDDKGAKNLVTLTTDANQDCLPYHARMPVFIALNEMNPWFQEHDVPELLMPMENGLTLIEKA